MRLIVLDTNVISEVMAGDASSTVMQWLRRQEPELLGITAVTVAEVSEGIARLPVGNRRDRIASQWDLLSLSWRGSFLALGLAEARMTGVLSAHRRRIGRPITMADACIAGTCVVHEAQLATRNIRDFEDLGLTLINPWSSTV
jgi:predicted nucleic acid-binding protein